MRPRDTSEKAAALMDAANRALTPGERMTRALELSQLLVEMARAPLRSRHPEFTEDEINRALTIQLHGPIPQRR